MKSDLLIIDGRHLLWRSSDAFSMLGANVNGKEIATGGMFGFLSILVRIYQKHGGNTAVVAWEGTNNFRFKLYPKYKKREEPTQEKLLLMEEMGEQEFRLKGMLRAIGIRQMYGVDCEADDVIGRLAKTAAGIDASAVIYSGDSDLRQLVNEHVTCVSPGYKGKEAVYDAEAVFKKHGVRPDQIADLKALAGDSSDGIPGAKGVGQKTAEKLLEVYGDIEGVISGANEEGHWADQFWPVGLKVRDTIKDSAEDIRLFKKLTTIDTNVKSVLIRPKRSQGMLLKHLRAYKFRSLMAPTELRQLMAMGWTK